MSFNELIADIYQIACDADPQSFQAAALNRLTSFVPLDTAFWMTRSEVNTPYEAEETYTHNLPEGVQDNYIKHPTVFEQALALNQVLAANMGKTFDVKEIIPQEEWVQSDMYLLHCKKYDIEHSLMTLYPSDHNQMIASISFNRHAHRAAFSEKEKLIVQHLVPHLAEAQRINIIRHMQTSKAYGFHRGIVDKHGHIIESSPNFIAILQQNALLSAQQVDLEKIVDRHGQEHSSPWLINTRQESGLIYIDIRKKPLQGLLSGKRFETARLLSQGKSNKFIALELDLSIETVNEYVGELYKLLNVRSRYEAIGCLLHSGMTPS